MYQAIYFGYGKVIPFIDSNGFKLAGFDIIVDGAATYPKHAHGFKCIDLFG